MKIVLTYKRVIMLLILLVAFIPYYLVAQVDMTIIVSFDQPPTAATTIKAPLKYNKDFALSMQIDDGHESIFTYAYPFFMGGEIGSQTYPGLTYTDGCGNDINFKMSTAQFSFNGDNENGPDTHVPGSGFGQVTWPQMDTLYKNGWGIINHGVNGNASEETGFMEYSLNRNKSYTRRKLFSTTEGGVLTRLHVNPNGSLPWSAAAFGLGYRAALNQHISESFMGNNGGNVNSSSVNFIQPQNLYRFHNANIVVTDYTQGLADSSINDDNYWGVIFTHSIDGEYPLASFISDFTIIESTFGSSGSDNILMTTDEEIINYLLIRDSLNLNSTLVGNTLVITVNGNLPNDLRYYALSLVINADENISNITVIGADSTNNSAFGSNDALINLFWDGEYIIPADILADSLTTIATNTQNQRDCWVAMDYVIVMENSFHKDSLRSVLCSIPGTTYDDGFCIDCSIDLGPDVTICEGDCETIYGPVDFDTYEWIVADTVFAISQDIFVCPVNSTQYILNVENDFCLTSDTIVYYVDPTPQFDLGNDTTLCLNDSLTIYGPDTTGLIYNFEWTVDGNLYATTQNITVSPADTTQYFLDVTNDSGCTGFDSIWVFVLPVPVAEIIQNDTVYSCYGDSTDFVVEGSGIDSYLWSTGETTQSIRVSPEIADSTYKYYVDIFNGYGCFVSDTVWLIVNSLPELELGNDTTLCFGDSLTIYGPDTTGLNYTFEWIVADTLFDTTQNITVAPADTTQYFLNVTNISGCIGIDSLWLNILSIPDAEIIQPDTMSTCFGDSTVFMVEGTDVFSYLWNTGDTTQSIKVSPETADTTYKYYVDIFNESGCYVSDTVWLEVNPVLLVNIIFDTIAVCAGDEVKVSVFVDNPLGVQYFIWHYYDNIDTLGTVLTFVPDASLNVYVQIVSVDSCDFWDSTYVQLNDKPNLIVSDDISICKGDTTTLSVSGADLYYWIVGQDTVSTESSMEVYPEYTTKYMVIGLLGSTCFDIDSVFVNVLPIPQTAIVYQGVNPVCEHGLVTLFANGADEYLWSTDETTEEISFIIEEETLIELIGTNNNGCVSLDSLRLFIKPADIVSFSGLLPAYCENDPASILLGEPSGGVFSGSGIVGNEFRPFLAGAGPKTIKYTYTNSENCIGIDTVTTIVYGSGETIDLGGDQTIHPSETIELDAGEGFDSYFWSTGSTYRNITIHYGDNPPASIIRYVVMGVINGCTSQGETNITFGDPFGIGENAGSRFLLFPNPNNGTFTISYLDEVQSFEIFVYDYFGKLLLNKDIDCNPECKTDIELPDLSKGLYFIKTVSEKGVSTGKLIVN